MDKLDWRGEVWPGSRPKPRPDFDDDHHTGLELVGLGIPMLIILLILINALTGVIGR